MTDPNQPTARVLLAEELFTQIWEQVEDGLDEERLLPSRERRQKDLAKKLEKELDRNGYRMFVSGSIHTMLHGKAPQRRTAEAHLVRSITEWRAAVLDLLPDRIGDLEAIIRAGIARPEKPIPRN